jgi:hypothetical protein
MPSTHECATMLEVRAHYVLAAASVLLGSACLIVFDGEEYRAAGSGGSTQSASTADTSSTGTATGSTGGGGGGPQLAPCDNGKCIQTIISTSENHGGEIVVDDTFVYWAEIYGNKVKRAPKDGTGDVVDVATMPRPVVALARDDADLFFATESVDAQMATMDARIGAAPLGETSEMPEILAQQQWHIAAATVNDQYVYFAETPDDTSFENRILRVPKAGGESPSEVASGVGWIRKMLVVDDTLYMTDTLSGHVLQTPKDGGGPVTALYTYDGVDAGPWRAVGLMANSRGFYFCQATSEVIKFLAHGANEAVDFAPGKGCSGIAGDDKWVYWVVESFTYDDIDHKGKVYAALVETGETFLIADDLYNPNQVAFDDEAVYVTTYVPNSGLVVRITVNR